MSQYNFTAEQLADARAGKIVQLTPEQEERLAQAQDEIEWRDHMENRICKLEDKIHRMEAELADLKGAR